MWLLAALAFLASDPSTIAEYRDAVALYEAVELEGARGKLEVALGQAEAPADRALIMAWMGLVDGQLGKRDDARRLFEAAVRLDPAVKLPVTMPESLAAELEAARARSAPAPAAAPPPATAVPSTPPSASAAAPAPGDARGPSFALLGVGAAVAGLGVVALAFGALDMTTLVYQQQYQSDAYAWETAGWAAYAVGAAAVVGGAGVVAYALLAE